jgi:hypothetical protein
VVVHTCNPSTREAEAVELFVGGKTLFLRERERESEREREREREREKEERGEEGRRGKGEEGKGEERRGEEERKEKPSECSKLRSIFRIFGRARASTHGAYS